MDSFEDKELISRIRDGDIEAFEVLVNIYGNRLLKTCYLILKDEKDAEDALQDTFLLVHKNIKKFKGKSTLYTWLYAIAVNQCRNRLRKKKELVPFDDSVEFGEIEDLEEKVMEYISKEKLRKELLSLPFIYREVLVLFYFNDLSIKEISEVLEEKEGTVKSKLSRGRNILQGYLLKGGFSYE